MPKKSSIARALEREKAVATPSIACRFHTAIIEGFPSARPRLEAGDQSP